MSGKADEQYSEEETQRRFEAALRGARMVGHKPMKSLPRKRVETKARGKKVKSYDNRT